MSKPRIIVESPFRATTEQQRQQYDAYLERIFAYCITHGNVPLASHKLYTKCLNDNIPEERELGISLGYELYNVADKVGFFSDFGWSEGMIQAREYIREHYPWLPCVDIKLNYNLH